MGIYVWGTGCGASELLEQGMEAQRITAFVDSFPNAPAFLGKPVLRPEELPVADCTLLIVTTRHTQTVSKRCAELGIPEEKILFLKNNCIISDRNSSLSAAEKILGEELMKKLLPVQHLVAAPASLWKPVLSEEDFSNDYVRLATLELLCRRLEGVPGAAAELGVYRGFFAGCIQKLLPGRKLYLFDSFEGFSPGDSAPEAFQAAHKNTSIQKVLSIMPDPDNVTVKAGFFPKSVGDLEERFCLVSLDVDFEQTTLDGLRWFWPRLEKGGYLLLHDWNSPKLPGVARALSRYEEERGHQIPSVPLCDLGGTLVLCKQYE